MVFSHNMIAILFRSPSLIQPQSPGQETLALAIFNILISKIIKNYFYLFIILIKVNKVFIS